MPVLLATAYLPPAGYLAEVVAAGEVRIEVFETYRKQTTRNHCMIYGPTGAQKLIIPVVKPDGNHTLTKNIRISGHQPWQKIHWRSIETAYNNSPFFLYYRDHLAPFYDKRWQFLLDLNCGLLEMLLRILRIERPVTFTKAFEKIPAGARDLRPLAREGPSNPLCHYGKYSQVFEYRHGFIPALSVIDLLFNTGPETTSYLSALSQHNNP